MKILKPFRFTVIERREPIALQSVHISLKLSIINIAIFSVHSKQHNQSAEELLFSVDTRPKFIEDAINRLISWVTLIIMNSVT